MPRLNDCPNCSLGVLGRRNSWPRKKRKMKVYLGSLFYTPEVCANLIALDSYGEAEVIVECEKKTGTGRSAVTSEWALVSRKGSQPGCVMGRTTSGSAVAL